MSFQVEFGSKNLFTQRTSMARFFAVTADIIHIRLTKLECFEAYGAYVALACMGVSVVLVKNFLLWNI